MINAPEAESRRHFESLLDRQLEHVPSDEWIRFRSKDGPFDSVDWQAMPKLHKALTEKRKR